MEVDMSLFFMLAAITSTGINSGFQDFYSRQETVETVTILSEDGNGIELEFSLNALTGREEYVEGFGSGTVFSVPGEGISGLDGHPDLPVVRRMVLVPDRGGIELELLNSESVDLGRFTVPPFQPLPLRNELEQPLRIDLDLYSSAEIYPEIPFTLESVEILRDIRIAWISFYPVCWNPSTGRAELITRATLRVSANAESGENELLRSSTGQTRSFIPMYRNVIGYEERTDTVDGSYLFISSEEGLDLIQDLIDWKHRKGFQVETAIVSQIGSSAAEIDEWIENAFNTWPNPPEYILLVGDIGVVPSPVYNGHAADNIYGVVGSGCVPSIHVGRLSGSDTEDLYYEAWKILKHETQPYQPATSWFQKGISVGHTEFTGNSYEYVQFMMAAGMTPTWFCANGGITPTVANLTDSLNSGCSLFGLCGHGNMTSILPPGFDIDDVAALSNGRRLGWWALVACQTGMFDQGYCFSEALMGEGDTLDVKGAIGVMSPTTNSPYGAADSLAKWIFEGYLTMDIRHMGAVTDWAKGEVFSYYGSSGVDNNHMHMVFGCPEMDVYYDTAPLAVINCSHPDPVTPGTHTFNVTADGSPAENLLVAVKVYDPAYGSWMESAYSDASGNATFTIPSFASGSDVYVTATGFNLYPYLYDSVTGTESATSSPLGPLTLQVSPVPCVSSVTLQYSLPTSGFAEIRVYDLAGRVAAIPVSGSFQEGTHNLAWKPQDSSGRPLPAGLYQVRLAGSLEGVVRPLLILD